MRVVYEAENLIDANLVRGVLEQAGIPVWVRGEYLTGAMGELPVSGLVAVCVPKAAWPDARRLVERLDSDLRGHLTDESRDLPEPDPDEGLLAV